MQQNMVLNVYRRGSKFHIGTTVRSKEHTTRYALKFLQLEPKKHRTVGYESPYYVGDADCLYLNVMKRENQSNTNLLPVFIQIHGGSSKHGNNTRDIWSRFSSIRRSIFSTSRKYCFCFHQLSCKQFWVSDLEGQQRDGHIPFCLKTT